MKIEQATLNIFIIGRENEAEILAFLEKNAKMLQSFLLVFERLSDEARQFMDEHNLAYSLKKNLALRKMSLPELKTEPKQMDLFKKEAVVEPKKAKPKIFKNLIRSGANIDECDDVAIFSRVNSGAFIKSKGSVAIFGKCDGDVECDGEYLIIGAVNPKSKITFRAQNIEKSLLKYRLNLITIEHMKLKIQDVLAF